MSTTPQYTPAQILDMGQRAEQEGNLKYAEQFYTYIAENFPETAEAAYARIGQERVERAQAAPAQAPATAPPPPRPAAPRHNDGDPRTGPPPKLSLDVSARPIAPNEAQRTNPPQSAAQQSPPQPQTNRPHTNQPSLSGPAPRTPAPEREPTFRARPDPQPQQAPRAAPAGQPPSLQPSHHLEDDSDNSPLPRVMRGDDEVDEDVAEYVPGYRFGRFLAFTMVLLGWLSLIGGLVYIAVAIAGVAGTEISSAYGGLPIGVVIGGSAFISGIVLVFVGSAATAVFEAANNTRELLEIERAKAGW